MLNLRRVLAAIFLVIGITIVVGMDGVLVLSPW